jgi:hypothetical protein
VINPPSQSSPSLSESTIKVAIENIAEASYLTIISEATAIDDPSQVLQHFETSQQGGKPKTSNSNSKKRGQQEMEQGPSEDKQSKKHRGKVAVPRREQSSRCDN